MERIEPKTYKIAVLTSGLSRGSNMRAMAQYFRDEHLPIEISFVVHTRKNAPIHDLCQQLEIKSIYLPYRDGNAFEQRLLEHLRSFNIDLLALAGFLKLLSASFCKSADIPLLNIHPALLPAYGGKGMYGMAVHEAVYANREKVSGASIHLVDPIYDHGRIIAQEVADVSHCQSPHEIASEVLTVEHRLYARAIREFFGL